MDAAAYTVAQVEAAIPSLLDGRTDGDDGAGKVAADSGAFGWELGRHLPVAGVNGHGYRLDQDLVRFQA